MKLRFRRRYKYLLALMIGAVMGTGFFTDRMLSAPPYRGEPSDHFDGERFHNIVRFEHGFRDFLRWTRNRQPGPWPDWVDAAPGPPPPAQVSGETLRVTFVNHSTVLVQMEGWNILTDPIWSERASPVSWMGPKRHRAPGIRFEDLPVIHLVLLSHNHYDHTDLATLRRLRDRFGPRIVTGLGNAAFLSRKGLPEAIELDWWESVELSPALRLTATPAAHFSSRGMKDRNGTLWAGFLLEGTAAGKVFFAGDTGLATHFAQIREKFGPVRLAMLPIGAYLPRWFMSPVHCSPADAVAAHQALGAETSMGIHFGTFQLADDAYDQPVRELAQALEDAGIPPSRFWALSPGESRECL